MIERIENVGNWSPNSHGIKLSTSKVKVVVSLHNYINTIQLIGKNSSIVVKHDCIATMSSDRQKFKAEDIVYRNSSVITHQDHSGNRLPSTRHSFVFLSNPRRVSFISLLISLSNLFLLFPWFSIFFERQHQTFSWDHSSSTLPAVFSNHQGHHCGV